MKSTYTTSTRKADYINPDRIDIQVEVQPVEFDAMSSTADGESSASIRARVVKAHDIQSRRFANNPEIHCNAQMTSSMLRQYCAIDSQGLAHLKEAISYRNLDRGNRAEI